MEKEQVYTMNEAQTKIINSLKKHEEKLYFIIHDKTTILDGKDTKANYDYINQNDIEMFYLGTKGGVTILQKDNVSACIVGEKEGGVSHCLHQMLFNLEQLLKDKGIECTHDNNDLLANGYKVCAFSSNYIEEYNWAFASITFTLNIDLDLVQSVCNKPMVKVPKGLSKFGITQEEIIELIEKSTI